MEPAFLVGAAPSPNDRCEKCVAVHRHRYIVA